MNKINYVDRFGTVSVRNAHYLSDIYRKILVFNNGSRYLYIIKIIWWDIILGYIDIHIYVCRGTSISVQVQVVKSTRYLLYIIEINNMVEYYLSIYNICLY